MSETKADERYISLRAGPLSAFFDPSTGGLRNVYAGDHCVWRALIVLVRDQEWQTIPGQLAHLQCDAYENRFAIRFECGHRSGALHFVWHGEIRGTAEGEIRYAFSGEARSTFDANRIGFCLLHPSELCAGRAVRQHRSDGRDVASFFPKLVEPQIVGGYSICDLRGLSHQIADGCWGHAHFEGDTFETEDQRNWTDASFKTYCTPLANPFPVTLEPGERRSQRVCLSVEGIENVPAAARSGLAAVSSDPPVTVSGDPRSQVARSPQLGLALCAAGTRFPSGRESCLHDLCEQLRVGFLRFDLVLAPRRSRQEEAFGGFAQAVGLAGRVERPLEVVLQLPAAGVVAWEDIGAWLRRASRSLARILVYRRGASVSRRDDVVALRRAVAGIDVPIGGGSDANFCELNREQALGQFPLDDMDFLAWSMNPQVHASDDRSLMETVRSLPDIMATAHSFASGKPLMVTPITLRPRFNAVATDAQEDAPWPMASPDHRQSERIAASWSIGTWMALAGSGTASTTWFETFGPRGVAPAPGDAEETDLKLFPVGCAFRQLASIAPEGIQPLTTSSPELQAAIVLGAHERHLLLVNLSPRDRLARIDPRPLVAAGNTPAEIDVTIGRYEIHLVSESAIVQNSTARVQ